MAVEIAKALEWLKLSPRHLTALAVVSGGFLALRANHLAYLGLTALDAKVRPWISVAFLASLGLLVTHGAFAVFARIQSKRKAQNRRAARIAQLHNLSPEEKAILALYIARDTKTVHMGIQSGVANGLVDAGLIYLASSVGTMSGGFAYNIQPWAWKFLREHPEVLLPENPATSDPSPAV